MSEQEHEDLQDVEVRLEVAPPEVLQAWLTQVAPHLGYIDLQEALAFDQYAIATMQQVVLPTPRGDGVRLHPLYEAALMERLQFDGDVPEARTGPLPPGARPAIPVMTDSRSMAQIGAALTQVSQAVQAQLPQEDDTQPQRPVTTALEAAIYPPGVRQGLVPTKGPETLALSPAEQQQFVWLSIATSQGRRSVAHSLEETLLADHSEAAVGPPWDPESDATGDSVAWTQRLCDQDEINPRFSALEAALQKFRRTLQGLHVRYLQVTPVNAIAQRTVGWTLRYWT